MDLFGDGLAAVAQELARPLDPKRAGLPLSMILDAVVRSGATIRGDALIALGSALNKAHSVTRWSTSGGSSRW